MALWVRQKFPGELLKMLEKNFRMTKRPNFPLRSNWSEVCYIEVRNSKK